MTEHKQVRIDLRTLKRTDEIEETIPTENKIKELLKITPTKIFVVAAIVISAICLVIGFYFMNLTKEKNKEHSTEQKIEQVANKEELKSTLEKSTKSINAPTKVTTENLLGNYLLGATTYYPDDPKKLYIDFTIKAPKEKVKQADDETAKKIIETFKSTLPKINETIEVKDKSKVSMEIYSDGNIYKQFFYTMVNHSLISILIKT